MARLTRSVPSPHTRLGDSVEGLPRRVRRTKVDRTARRGNRQQEGDVFTAEPNSAEGPGRGEEHQVIRDSNQRKFNRQKSVNYRGRRRMVRSGITVKVCTMRRGRDQLRLLGRTANFGAALASGNASMSRRPIPRFPERITERKRL